MKAMTITIDSGHNHSDGRSILGQWNGVNNDHASVQAQGFLGIQYKKDMQILEGQVQSIIIQ